MTLRLLPLAIALTAFTPHLQAASYAISSLGKTEIVGSRSDVPNSGSSDNFSSGPITIGSTYAKFRLVDSKTSARYADMKITVAGVTGTLDAAGSKSGVMVAQTSNSQGLVDTGTISILTGFSKAASNGETSVSFLFEFFQPDSNVAMNVGLEITSFDFDYRQFMQGSHSDFSAAAHGSNLTRTTKDGISRWADTKNTDAQINQASNAVVLNNVADSSFSLTFGKVGTGNSLFMLEFRDPSQILSTPLTPVTIPEPSALLMVGLSACAGVMVRRRRIA